MAQAGGEQRAKRLLPGVRVAQACSVVLALAAALLATSSAAAAGARLTVCTIALHEPHEIEAFRHHLDARQFEVVDLHARARARRPLPFGEDDGAPWISAACSRDTRCDVLVITAEFAGRFFGKAGSLGLQELEEASCQAQCSGLFQAPAEVFLMACNSLASKDHDSRTPDEYRRILLEHGFDRGAAERVVALRYGPLGPSFRESLRRVFAGVPRLYGFSSVAPRGEITAPRLARYLDAQGDYGAALRARGRDAGRNAALMAAFRGTAMTQAQGLSEAERGAADRAAICALYDASRPVLERLRIAYGLLLRPDALRFVPTVQVFLARHPRAAMTWMERAVLLEMRAIDHTREQVLDMVARLPASSLQLELAHFAELVGWIEPRELRALAIDAARQLLREPLSAEVVDSLCAITTHVPLRRAFGAGDLPPRLYRHAQGLRLVSCLAPRDARVAAQVAAALADGDAPRRQWAAHALTRLQPRDPAVLLALVPHAYDRSAAVAERVRWVLESQPLPTAVARALRAAAAHAPADGTAAAPESEPLALAR